MTSAPIDFEALRALAEKATPGEWGSDESIIFAQVERSWTESGCCGQPLDNGECCGNAVQQDCAAPAIEQIASASSNDAAFIAAANPAVVLALIAERAELVAQRDGLAAEAKTFIPFNLNISNPNVSDNVLIPIDVTMGEFRRLHAALSALTATTPEA